MKKLRSRHQKNGDILKCNLPGDITIEIPMTLYVDSLHTLPYSPSDMKEMLPSKPNGFSISGNDRSSRLALVAIIWNILSQFNLYIDSESTWNDALKSSLLRAAQDINEDAFLKTLKQLVAELQDGQSRVWMSKDQFRYALPFLWKWLGDKLIVTKTVDEFTTFRPGDEIIGINDTATDKYLSEIEKYISGSTKAWKRIRAIAELRAGEQNSTLKLKVKSQSGLEIEKNIPRNIIFNQLIQTRPDEFVELKPGTFYIDVTRVNDEAFRKLVDKIKDAKQIVFDMRGFSQVSDHFLRFFVDKPIQSMLWRIPVYTAPDKGMISHKYITNTIKPKSNYIKANLTFLCDERTIGYAEAMLEIVKKYKLGKVIGTPTAGSGGEIFAFNLPGDYHISMTGLDVLDYNNKIIYGDGVKPDITVIPSIGSIIEDKDDILLKALEVLGEK